MDSVYQYIHANYDSDPDVNAAASRVHLNTSAFCRCFKKQPKMTFTDFVNQYRFGQVRMFVLKDVRASNAYYQ
ncbi:AraC family transcriptional regulator [Segetibacter aerophilus]|uniref:HTH araC/xylS-type domain-containing protein n=1 Tax=Segetibacter aerophilus TaxID=670293 RepID=A0A512BJS4_9BACT|nr:AraC family transcriptional regulator [Segetibacter aerophilus]GEO12216.1 hypothetical protein SAE01_47120 [Segetibacter aerophilus]